MTTELAELARYGRVPVPDRPALVTWVQPVQLGDGQLQLRSAECFYSLRHPLMAETFISVHSLLDGDHSVEEVLASAPAGIAASTVLFLLKVLNTLGLLLDASAPDAIQPPTGTICHRRMFVRHFQDDPEEVVKRLAAANILAIGSKALVMQVHNALGAAGCECVSPLIWGDDVDIAYVRASVETHAPDLMIACADAPMRAMTFAINQLALEAGLTWMQTTILGKTALLGPIMIPAQTACFRCLNSRLCANMSVAASDALPSHEAGSSGEFFPWHMMIAGQIALEATRFLGKYAPPTTVSACFELSSATPATKRHTVLRVPSCPLCGSGSYAHDGW